MEEREAATALGAVRMWARFGAFDTRRPLVLVIAGAFAELDFLHWLDDGRAGADLAFLHLPGFHTPPLAVTSIGAFVRAYESAAELLLPGRRYLTLGVSTGALAAMAMRRAAGVVAVEPFFSTQPLWALHELLGGLSMDQRGRAWVEAIFGNAAVNRDYFPILEGLSAPTEALVGDVPLLPRRPVRGLPSLTSEQDRARLAANPNVSLGVVPGRHNLPEDNPQAIRDALERCLRRVTAARLASGS